VGGVGGDAVRAVGDVGLVEPGGHLRGRVPGGVAGVEVDPRLGGTGLERLARVRQRLQHLLLRRLHAAGHQRDQVGLDDDVGGAVLQAGGELVDPGPVGVVAGRPAAAVVAAVAAGGVVDHQDRDLAGGGGRADQRVHLAGDLAGVVVGEPGRLRHGGDAVADRGRA